MSEKKSSVKKDSRTRNWTCVIYPGDSAPDNWRDILDEEHIEWVESPLHDKDINGDGTTKKPHIHLLLMFGGVKTSEQVKEITDKLNCPIPIKVHNAKSLVRYMAHLDNPEKVRYSVADIKSHGGVDLEEMLRPSASERYIIIKEILEYVKLNNIIEFQDLLDYAIECHFDDWFPLLCDNSSYVCNMYIKSQRHRFQVK